MQQGLYCVYETPKSPRVVKEVTPVSGTAGITGHALPVMANLLFLCNHGFICASSCHLMTQMWDDESMQMSLLLSYLCLFLVMYAGPGDAADTAQV